MRHRRRNLFALLGSALCLLVCAGGSLAAAPANDNFAAAQALSGLSGTISGSNVEATNETGEPDHAGFPGGHSVWFRWTAPSSGGATFDTSGSSFNTTLAIYTGTSVDALTAIASNDNGGGPFGLQSKVTFQVQADTTYSIAVDGNGAGAKGSVTLRFAHYGNPAPPPGADPNLIAAGDIAGCGVAGDEATALLVSAIPGTVAPLGDNVYESGSADEYDGCYGPNWGNFKSRSRPTPGNHEYLTTNAAGYFGYFGAPAGDPAKGYYSYDLGAWHIVSLNGNCGAVGGCETGSAQQTWLASDLASHPTSCTLAYWHQPRFSSGEHGSDTAYQPFWQTLYNAGADVVLAGHDHNYERFLPQTPAGAANTMFGIREFVVGTGGASHDSAEPAIANSVALNYDTFGVLKLTLHPGSYDWQFVPETTKSFTDSGSGSCHGVPGPTAVQLLGLAARSAGDGVRVSWRTESENGWIGFEVTGPRGRVNRRPIPSRGSATSGATYRVVDRSAPRRVQSVYLLCAIRLDGSRAPLGAVSSRPR